METTLERLLKREQLGVLAGLVAVTALAWAYLIVMAAGMDMDGGSGAMGGAMGEAVIMAKAASWTPVDLALMFLMWAIMMVGMMLPSAAPMILLFAMVSRKQQAAGAARVATGVFASGYLAVWAGFSLLAALAQWGLHEAALLSPMMVATSNILAGGLFVAAGVYQWTPLKHACLENCRSPLHFISHHWRRGTAGALRMGVEHGAFCVGCCWFLMGLLFALGVMNLLWVAAIALFVLAEKVLPHGQWIARASGVLMVLAGTYLLAGA